MLNRQMLLNRKHWAFKRSNGCIVLSFSLASFAGDLFEQYCFTGGLMGAFPLTLYYWRICLTGF